MMVDQLKPNRVLRGPIVPEPVQVIVVIPLGDTIELVGKGLNTGKVYESILTPEKLALLETTPDTEPFDGDSQMFRLGIEAMRLQLESVYDYFLRLLCIRFLLADDPSAGNDQRFWRLAQVLFALYPTSTDEKRWVDGVLARKKGLGF